MALIKAEAEHIDRPRPGFWMVRLVRGGPEVAACIRWEQTTHEPGNPENLMERSPSLVAYIAGEPVASLDLWTMRRRPITVQEYNAALAKSPATDPRQRIDPLTAPLPTF